MKTMLRNIVGITLFILIVFLISNYSTMLKEQAGVQGVKTDRAQEISADLSSDVTEQVNVAADKAGEVKVSQIVDFFGRFQKIPTDVNNAKLYVTEQINGVLKSRENK